LTHVITNSANWANMENIYLRAALEYEKLGISVIPLVPGHKFPPKSVTWKDRQTTRATSEDILKWWVDYPKSHVGMITGAISGIDSIDMDGPHAKDILEAQAGVELPDSISYTTGNGMQVLFKYHGGGLKTKARYCGDSNGSGVDLRTDGGLTVLPPSIHKNGKQYEWIIDPTEMGLNDLEDFPQEVLSFMAKQCMDSAGKAQNSDRVVPDKWFKEGIPDGRKHHDLYRYACKCISRGMAYDETLACTIELARRCDPLPKDGPEKAARVRVTEAFQKYGKEYSDTPGEEGKPPNDITIVTLGEIHRMKREFPPPLIDGLLERGDSLLISGQGGLGKSLVTL